MEVEKLISVIGESYRNRVLLFKESHYGMRLRLMTTGCIFGSDLGPSQNVEYLYTQTDNRHLFLVAAVPDWPILTRREAANLGYKKYWNGRPCAKGHISKRYTKGGACVKCLRLNRQKNTPVIDWVEKTYTLHRDDVDDVEAYINAKRLMRTVAK